MLRNLKRLNLHGESKGEVMNPVFIFLVSLGAVLLWFLLSFAFRPIGKLFYRLWKDAVDEINKNDETKDKKEREEQ